MPAILLVAAAFAGAVAPDVARAQEPRAQLEVSSVEATEGGTLVTVSTSAALPGSPTVKVDGASRTAEVTAARRPAVVLAIETSSSMSVEQLAAVRHASAAFLGQLPATTQVAVVTFDTTVRTAGFAADISAAQTALDNLVSTGGSALFDGLSTAAARLRDHQHASATVVVVTHGWDWGSASASSRADSYAAVQGLAAEVYPVVVGGDFDTTLVSGLANPPRTAPWRVEDLAGGGLAAAVAAGARAEQQIRFATAGLDAGPHEVAIGWNGPATVTPVVRSFAVATAATNGAAAAGGETFNGTSPGQSAPSGAVPAWAGGGAVVAIAAFGLLWFARKGRGANASKLAGRLELASDAIEPPARLAPGLRPSAVALAASAPRDGSEQRAFERVRLGVPAELSLSGVDAGGVQSVTAFDISEGGLSFRAHSPIAPGSHGYLSMALPPNGDEVQLHVLILNVVPVDTETYSAHCSFIDITPRTLWRIVGACLALSGDTANAADLMNWGGRHAQTADQLQADPLFEPVTAEGPTDQPGRGAETVFAFPEAADTAAIAPTAAASLRFPWEEEDAIAAGEAFETIVGAGTPVTASASAKPDEFDIGEAFEPVSAFEEEVDDGASDAVEAGQWIVNADAFELVTMPDDAASADAAEVPPSAMTGAPNTAVVEATVPVGPDFGADELTVHMDPFETSPAAEFRDTTAAPFGIEEVVVDDSQASEPVAVEFPAFASVASVDADATVAEEICAEPVASAIDDRTLRATKQLAWLLGDPLPDDGRAESGAAALTLDAHVQVWDGDSASSDELEAANGTVGAVAEVDVDERIGTGEQAPVPSLVTVRSEEMQETRFEAAATGDEVRCSHCTGGVLELQRLVRQDEFLESWWLCLACSRITYRQQEPEAWLRTTSVPDGLDDPRTPAPATDFDAMVRRVRQEEAVATARAAQLRDELARTESVLHDIRMLHRLLERFGVDAAPAQRVEGESPAA